MQFRIETLTEKKLLGMRILLSLSENKTRELWKSFITRKGEIRNRIGTEFYSMQIYDDSYFNNFNPNTKFEKWASVEVPDFDHVPKDMETTILPAGLYAVFFYKGSSAEAPKIFQYIFGTWLPESDFSLDNRPHFEVLGNQYHNDDPNSEEEIWIPIRLKS
ncbi:GyrI-like domain-containing protein [Leptospira sp. 201903070]|jgi:AraC family transcriptional regulator|uniref:GyrI-like domain-containing protein n=1 Tax=Leptospira ainlahdjerensis TaxID=2810033 RepID=A0ABS2U6S6_9LEPT|nr:GyrI-like domain-containing protein [Leptospira ainlahdjerensis]MBM9576072.1 GyrI-like domain-containing protein [Leptospira ainlahdjerensis]